MPRSRLEHWNEDLGLRETFKVRYVFRASPRDSYSLLPTSSSAFEIGYKSLTLFYFITASLSPYIHQPSEVYPDTGLNH